MEDITKSNVLQIIGKNIKRIRLLRGLSQETLASDLQKSINRSEERRVGKECM